VLSESDFERAQSDQMQFMIEVADAVTALAQESPVTVMIDDLHLADPASLQLFAHLAGVLVKQTPCGRPLSLSALHSLTHPQDCL
jgi:predicted ATPase